MSEHIEYGFGKAPPPPEYTMGKNGIPDVTPADVDGIWSSNPDDVLTIYFPSFKSPWERETVGCFGKSKWTEEKKKIYVREKLLSSYPQIGAVREYLRTLNAIETEPAVIFYAGDKLDKFMGMMNPLGEIPLSKFYTTVLKRVM
jgi:hypothetical protein